MKTDVKRSKAGLTFVSAFAVLATLGMAAAVAPAAAQVRGLPVYNAGVARGFGISADVGLPNADAGKGLGYGVTGSAGIGPGGSGGHATGRSSGGGGSRS